MHPLSGFQQWLDTPCGNVLAELEQRAMLDLLTSRYYPSAVQLGAPRIGVMPAINCRSAIQLVLPDDGPVADRSTVISAPHPLPFTHHTFDLMVLPHTLDFAVDPYPLLREYTQVMMPDGYLLISGFQPLSLWGLSRFLRPVSRRPAWSGHFFSVRRIQDWLLLLGYEVRSGRMLMYRPPLSKPGLMQRLQFMEQAGNRWWPMLGAVYVILARLKTMQPLTLGAQRNARRIKARFPQPVSQNKVKPEIHHG